ncbi:hypothetical protein [Silvibacterium dinghuense]|uniref:Uncharacterized protein n=1 Tax=Silvibacterium dinghuense TaxID=1560006 RepID=A0A4Q1S904_9BACT|nr:hypothetical protein [Silvibacterium dinghuense]RXS93474.1 hypothetical protein ESZ00_19245 [Silvibacterium dinghuense]GGH06152.1 hypothetical protein GCM10011586_22940 [Silvibacterium dinghuense]
MRYDEILACIDAEIRLLQQAKELLLTENQPLPEKPARKPKAAKPRKSQYGRVAVKRIVWPMEAPVVVEPKVKVKALRQPVRRRAVRAKLALPSALTHTVPDRPVAVSPDDVRRAREKALAASVPQAPVESAPAPEVTEELLRRKWTLQ